MSEVLEPLEAAPLEDEDACELPPFVVRFEPVIHLDDEQFFQFCVLNRDLRIERNADGEIILMYPEGLSSGAGNAELTRLFANWAKRDGTGTVFASSAGFTLPNKAVRAPDVSWVTKARLRELPEGDWDRFGGVCPDFVLELRSKTDSMRVLKAKMAEYMACGSRLGWLINPFTRRVFVYRPGAPAEELHDPPSLSGESVLPGFVLKLADLWEATSGEG
jgi:Uma2 family endonuclease